MSDIFWASHKKRIGHNTTFHAVREVVPYATLKSFCIIKLCSSQIYGARELKKGNPKYENKCKKCVGMLAKIVENRLKENIEKPDPTDRVGGLKFREPWFNET